VQLGKVYWKSYWAFVEWGIILDAFVAAGLFAYKRIETAR
jgi:hypothetical protein